MTVKVSGGPSLIIGLALPLLALVVLSLVGVNAEQPAAAISFMVAVPMFAAAFASVLVTVIVAAATVGTAVVTAGAAYGQSFAEATAVLLGVILGAAIAVIVSQVRVRRPMPTPTRPARSPVPARVTVTDAASDTDDLTGLPTRTRVTRLFADGAGPGPHVVALIDLDDLAGVNAAYGRGIGDTFLFAVAGRTRYALADADTVARWDGGQFLVVMAGDMESAMPTLEVIADKVNAHPIRTDAGLVPATMSMGVASWAEGTAFADACARARRAMHAAKGRGGRCLVVSGEAGP